MVDSSHQSPPVDGSRTDGPAVSVAIRSYTRTDEVLRLIDSLIVQTLCPREIVVIDSGSAPRIIAALRRMGEQGASPDGAVALRLIEIPNADFTSAGALNRAIEEARFELVAIVSQDAMPADAHYLERLAAAMAEPDVAGAYGRQVLGDEYDALGEKDLATAYPPVSRVQGRGECWFVNTCSIVRRSLWRRHAFDPGAGISEDHEWGKWATDEGFRIRYVADAVVRHYHPFPTAGMLWRRHYGEGRGLAYVHGDSPGLARSALRCGREIGADAVWLLRRGMAFELPRSVWRRAVKYLALWKGGRDELREERNRQ